jgi:hypothetical protein
MGLHQVRVQVEIMTRVDRVLDIKTFNEGRLSVAIRRKMNVGIMTNSSRSIDTAIQTLENKIKKGVGLFSQKIRIAQPSKIHVCASERVGKAPRKNVHDIHLLAAVPCMYVFILSMSEASHRQFDDGCSCGC